MRDSRMPARADERPDEEPARAAVSSPRKDAEELTGRGDPVRFGGWSDYSEWAEHDFRARAPSEEAGVGGQHPIVVETLTAAVPIKLLEEVEEFDSRKSCRISSLNDEEDWISVEAGDLIIEIDWSSALIRPYVRADFRSDTKYELSFETLITTTAPYAVLPHWALSEDQRKVCRVCATAQSVAEIAVAIEAPLGLTLTIISEGIDHGFLRVHSTAAPTTEGLPSIDLLRRVYAGLARLG